MQAVPKALAHEVELDETDQGAEQDLRATSTFTAGKGSLCCQRGVTILFGQIAGKCLGGFVQEIARQVADRVMGEYLLVNGVIRPLGVLAVKQAQAPVRVAFAKAQVAPEKTVAAREAVRLMGWCGKRGFKAGLQGG